jgi:hypothetical protein
LWAIFFLKVIKARFLAAKEGTYYSFETGFTNEKCCDAEGGIHVLGYLKRGYH